MQIINENGKEYLIVDMVKYLLIEGVPFKVMTKEEFVERAVKDMEEKKKARELKAKLEEEENMGRLRLKSMLFAGTADFDYDVKETDSSRQITIIKAESDERFVLENKFQLDILIEELTELREHM